MAGAPAHLTALTIAGSDPTGGAGLQADLRTFDAHGLTGASVVTAVTVQSSQGVASVFAMPAQVVAAQIEALLGDAMPDATKIGMLATAATVEAVANALARHRVPRVVLDPVIQPTRGVRLLEEAALSPLVRRLLPLAAIVTPNTEEAAALTGRPVRTLADARTAARALVDLGARAAVVTGGHLEGDPVDVLFAHGALHEFPGTRVTGPPVHGTGCVFAAALAAALAHDAPLEDAVAAAKAYVAAVIRGKRASTA